MPPPEGRAGSLYVYIVSCLFFLILISGGVFLLLYIILPESETTAFFPVIGIVLVGIPWAFWILTCLYRAFAVQDPSIGAEKWAPAHTTSIAPATTGEPKTPPASQLDGTTGDGTFDKDGDDGKAAISNGKPSHHVDGSNEGSSLASHESEAPLALSMP